MTINYEDLKQKVWFMTAQENRYSNYYGPTPAEYDYKEEIIDYDYEVDDDEIIEFIAKKMTGKELNDLPDEMINDFVNFIVKHHTDLIELYIEELREKYRKDAEKEVEEY